MMLWKIFLENLDLVKSNIQEQIKLEEKNLSNLEKELNTLFRDKDSYIKEIEKAKALIAQREQDILNNEDNQTKKTGQIEIQKEIISTIKSKLREFEY
jgi:chromosome segregation ATPase